MSDELPWVAEPPIKPMNDDEKIDAELFGRAEVIFVAIYENAVYDDEATQLAGRPRYRNAPFIAVREKGTKDFVSRPVNETDKRRFPRAWKSWEARISEKAPLPLQLLPGMRPAPLRELRDLKIESVEALAAYDGELGDLSEFRALAKRLGSLAKPRLRLVGGQLVEAVA
jgi:hypothetical protein